MTGLLRSRVARALTAAGLIATLLVSSGAQAVPERTSAAAPACTALAGAETAGAKVDTLAVLNCVGAAVTSQRSVHVSMSGILAGEAWVSWAHGLKAFIKLGDGTRALMLPKAVYVNVPGETKGWHKLTRAELKQAGAALTAMMDEVKKALDGPALLAALAPCASMVSSGVVSNGIQVACPSPLKLTVMDTKVKVQTVQLVLDPATSLPASVTLGAVVQKFPIAETVDLAWGSRIDFAKLRTRIAQRAS